jgi:hypothetical protein
VKRKHSIHRLLGLQYLENPDNLREIDHIDRNKLNNNLENLRWVSRQTNNQNRSWCLIYKTEEEIELKKQAQKEKGKLKARDRRANLTEEEHAKLLAQQKEHYANGGRERQQEYLKLKSTPLTII